MFSINNKNNIECQLIVHIRLAYLQHFAVPYSSRRLKLFDDDLQLQLLEKLRATFEQILNTICARLENKNPQTLPRQVASCGAEEAGMVPPPNIIDDLEIK